MKKILLSALVITLLASCDVKSILNKPKELIDNVTGFKLTPEKETVIKEKLLFKNNINEIGETLRIAYGAANPLVFHDEISNGSDSYYETDISPSYCYLLGNFNQSESGENASKVCIYVEDTAQTDLLKYHDEHNIYKLKNSDGVFYHNVNLICKEYAYNSSNDFIGEKGLGSYQVAIIYDVINEKTIIGRHQMHYFEYSICSESEFNAHSATTIEEHDKDENKCYIKGVCSLCGKEKYLYDEWNLEKLTAGNAYIPLDSYSYDLNHTILKINKINYLGSGFKGKNFHCSEYNAVSVLRPFVGKEEKIGIYDNPGITNRITISYGVEKISIEYEKLQNEANTYIEYISIICTNNNLYLENKIVIDD